MTIFVYISIFLAGYSACYLVTRRKLSARLYAKAIKEISGLKDELQDQKMMFSEHRASHLCVEVEEE